MIGLDANAFIYLFENNVEFADYAQVLFEAAEQGSTEIIASEMAIFEVLSPAKYTSRVTNDVLKSMQMLVVSFRPTELTVLLKAAELRRAYGFGAMDSIHVASAITAGCTHFVTNDRHILRRKVPGIHIVSLKTAAKLIGT